MEIEPLEVFARDSNYSVIKPPSRQYPGWVLNIKGVSDGLDGSDANELCDLTTIEFTQLWELGNLCRNRHRSYSFDGL